MGENLNVVDAEIVDEKAKYDGAPEWATWSNNIAIIFATEPKSIDEIVQESNKRFHYGENLTRQCLAWLQERGLARPRSVDGVVHWGRSVDAKRLVGAAADVVEVVSHPVAAMGGERAASVMREAAATARSIPAAVEGIKKEARPVLDAARRLGDAAKAAGIFRLREPLEVSLPKSKENGR